jgi:hypothetical protein
VAAIDNDLDLPAALAIVREILRADLAADERRWLVLDTDLVWMMHSNLLEVYGLPVSRDETRALLDEADAANASSGASAGQPPPGMNP